MATLTIIDVNRSGWRPEDDAIAANVGGDQFANDGRPVIWVKNASGGPLTVQVEFADAADIDGVNAGTKDIVVGAGEESIIGPFPTTYFNDASGFVQVGYSGVTSLTVAAFRFDSDQDIVVANDQEVVDDEGSGDFGSPKDVTNLNRTRFGGYAVD